MVARSIGLGSVSLAISIVVSLGADQKMARVDAMPHPTGVPDHQSFEDWPVGSLVGDDMRSFLMGDVHEENAVPSLGDSAGPRPARFIAPAAIDELVEAVMDAWIVSSWHSGLLCNLRKYTTDE
jgi:hypothetical protein